MELYNLAHRPVTSYNETTTEEVNGMADQQQLDLLRQGVEAWNAWREQYPETYPDFRGANLSEASLGGVNLEGADLSEANFVKADLSGATLSKVTLNEAILYGVNLRGADLRGADLRGANLNVSDLNRADLSRANLGGARLIGANFSGANLNGANFSRASIGWTIFGDVDLRTVRELETVKHDAPSTIGADTILRSEGDIPEKFLRDAGLTDAFIISVRSLTQYPVKYYTCFISYSSKDLEFVERLHTDLQANSVRCWFAPEDLKIGEKFWPRIDESILLYDKLLVVLSEHSVNSEWVEREVMAALEKEQHNHKTALFPIKLDETVMQTSLPWAASIRRARHIGDFTRWKDHDVYQKGLERLLRDLQHDSPPTSKS